MDATATDTIDQHGDPLAFKIRSGTGRAQFLKTGGTIKVEARQMNVHQKEAVVTEGTDGSAWRLTSDEGKHLKGSDLAPFPLGFFNAGLQGDLYGHLRALAAVQNVSLGQISIRLVNHYWLTGSFIHGTGEGHAEAPDIEIGVQSPASADVIAALVTGAIQASPAMALLRTPLAGNTFALYINGRRRNVDGVANSPGPDAVDPYHAYSQAPRPLDANARRDLIEKTGIVEPGETQLAAANITNKLIRNVIGDGKPADGDGLYEIDTFLGLPGGSHYWMLCDESERQIAPTGLALLSAGIAFCYMTQLARYIQNMKMNIRNVRLVQFSPFTAGAAGTVVPIDTHLFLNGEAPEQTHVQLLTIAARTCYLHAAARTPVDPIVRIVHNGAAIARAA
jgi:uncharacterized OsmC-like protein